MNDKTEARRRLAILVELSLAKRWTLTVHVIRESLDRSYPGSMAVYRADAVYLEETGLVHYNREADALALREAGIDVAQGNTEMVGVAQPGPVR